MSKQRRTQVERKDDAERKMLESGVRLVAESGLQNLTLAEVGKGAGFSRGLPAHHFGSKSDFQGALIRFVAEEYRKGMESLSGEPGLARLTNLINSWFELSFKDPVYHCAMNIVLAEHGRNRNSDPDIAELRNTTIQAFADQIKQGMKKKEIRADADVNSVTLLLIAAVCGVLEYSLVDPGVDNIKAGDQLVKLVLGGLKA